MSDAADVRFTLKAVINKEKTRVLFAEVGNDFVDLLFSFMILPFGNIMQVLTKHYGENAPTIGSLKTLYNSLGNIADFHLQFGDTKPSILNPESAYAFPYHNVKYNVSNTKSCTLGKSYFMVFRVFTEDKATFIICDDRIVPNGKGSLLQTLGNFGVDTADLDGAVTRNVTFGLDEIMDYLRGLMIYRHPLTDIILGTRWMNPDEVNYHSSLVNDYFLPSKPEALLFLKQIETEATSTYSKKMTWKATFQKSTNRFLFAQAGGDFVYYLFTLLTFPLGIFRSMFGNNACLYGCEDKQRKDKIMYISIVDLINPKYLSGTDTEVQLYKCETFPSSKLRMDVKSQIYNSEGLMYMVTDDLTVTPLCVFSTLSLLNQMKISLSDVEEKEILIGFDEFVCILLMSLTSTCSLSEYLK